MSFTVNDASFSQVFSDYARVEIPAYQRDYDWTKVEWGDLWKDLLSVLAGGETYFIGPLNAERLPNGNGIQIADGQQRITTLSILLSSMRSFVSAAMVTRIDDTLFGGQSGKPLVGRPTRLVDQTEQGRDALQRVLSAQSHIPFDEVSTKHDKALNFFFENVGKLPKAEVEKLAEYILDNVVFARVVALNAGSGIKMFERANTRGRPLTFTDKLKSLLIGTCANSEAPEVIKNWASTVLNLREAGKYEDRYFYYWLAADYANDDKIVRASNALEIARATLDAHGVLSCSRHLLEYSKAVQLIAAGKTPKGGNECGSLANLQRFAKFSQLSRLLPAARHLTEDQFIRFAEDVENTVCVIAIAKAFPPNIEKLIPGLLKTVRDVRDRNSTFDSLRKELSGLRNSYSADFGDKFLNGTYADFRRPYLLTMWGIMEQHVANSNRSKNQKKARHSVSISEMSVEHILAQSSNARAAAREYGLPQATYDRQRFANLTPLEKGLNYGMDPYSVKSKSYVNSNFFLTRTMSSKYQDYGLKTLKELRKKYLPMYRRWNRDMLVVRADRLYRLACVTFEIHRETIEVRSPDSPSLDSIQLLPRVSSYPQLANGLQALADGDRPQSKLVTTLRFLGLVDDDEDGEEAISELGRDVLAHAVGEQPDEIRKVVFETPYVVVWKDLSDRQRRETLRKDILSIAGQERPTVTKQIAECLNSWVSDLT